MLNLRVNKDLRYIFNWTGWDAKLLQSIKPMLAFFYLRIRAKISIRASRLAIQLEFVLKA
jgi:hypothetical protein